MEENKEKKEKKVTKVSMSTCLFISSLIIICVMAFFIYKFYDDKTKANNEVNDLKNQVNNLQNQNNSLQNTVNSQNDKNNAVVENTNSATTNNTFISDSKKSYSYSDLKGRYIGTKEINGATVEFGLSLFENGTFVLQDVYVAPKGPAGNYIIVDDVLKLNILFNTTSSTDIKNVSGNFEIKINGDGSLTVNNYIYNKDTIINNILLTKSNDLEQQDIFNENSVQSMIFM